MQIILILKKPYITWYNNWKFVNIHIAKSYFYNLRRNLQWQIKFVVHVIRIIFSVTVILYTKCFFPNSICPTRKLMKSSISVLRICLNITILTAKIRIWLGENSIFLRNYETQNLNIIVSSEKVKTDLLNENILISEMCLCSALKAFPVKAVF